MSAQATHAQPHTDPGQQAEDAQLYRQVLHDLIHMGTDLARILHTQAVAQAQAAVRDPALATPLPDPTIAFDRTARTIRRCIALARTLSQPLPLAPDPARRRTAARKRSLREVEDTIQRTEDGAARDDDTMHALNAELRDRLDAPDLDDDIATRPVPEIIKEICRDLGLDALPGTRPFKRRTPADAAQLCACAAAPTPAHQPGTGPNGPKHDATQRPPDPQPDQRADVLHTQPSPVHANGDPPDNPAKAMATILTHPTRAQWHPPPGQP